MEQHLTTCKERVRRVILKNVYQLCERLFSKLDPFGILYRVNQKLFIKKAIFDFESVCVEGETFQNSKTTIRIVEQFPNSVWISFNLMQEPIVVFDPNRRDLISSFNDALENLALQSKTQHENELP